MTETKDTTDKTLRGGARKPLSLQRTVESGHVRQNFSHGRSKSVVVEKRKTRKLGGPGGAEPEVASSLLPSPSLPSRASPRSRRRAARGRQVRPAPAAASPTRNATRAHAHSPPRASATTLSASRNSPAPSAKPQLRLPRRRPPPVAAAACRGRGAAPAAARAPEARAPSPSPSSTPSSARPPRSNDSRPERRRRASAHVLQSGAAAA